MLVNLTIEWPSPCDTCNLRNETGGEACFACESPIKHEPYKHARMSGCFPSFGAAASVASAYLDAMDSEGLCRYGEFGHKWCVPGAVLRFKCVHDETLGLV